MVFIRKIKKKSGTYLAEVEGYRVNGKVRQRVIKYLGKEINGKAEKRVLKSEIKIKSVRRSLDVLAVDAIARELSLTNLKNKYALALVYSQVLEKHSINQLEEWLRFTEIPDILNLEQVSTKELYESLGDIDEEELREINEKLYPFFKKYDDSCDVAVIDVTDTYYAGSHEEIKRRKGKESKVEKLIQVGLAVSFKQGFPLFHKKYHGNLNNVHIFKDMALELQSRNLNGVIVDRGMTSDENITLSKKINLKIIGGIKKTITSEFNEVYFSEMILLRQPTINRLNEFSKLKKSVFSNVIHGDSREADIFGEIKKQNPEFYKLLVNKKIDGVFTSPPYVGQIDYHEQHAYAYELFDIARKDDKEIGPLFNGQGQKAKEEYVEGISKVFINISKFVKDDGDFFVVANDKYDLYPIIAEKSGLKIVEQFKRPVLNRTERDRQPYAEIIFHMRKK